jgi:hypothetical protein
MPSHGRATTGLADKTYFARTAFAALVISRLLGKDGTLATGVVVDKVILWPNER